MIMSHETLSISPKSIHPNKQFIISIEYPLYRMGHEKLARFRRLD